MSRPAPLSWPVHPHGCGEHVFIMRYSNQFSGSSPRVWGTHFLIGGLFGAGRFIPTGVGNTTRPRRESRPVPVHPHGCGEHALASCRPAGGYGSSPRVWGTRPPGFSGPSAITVHPHGCGEHATSTTVRSRSRRFIPTGVGNTIRLPYESCWIAVHPHGCGEHATDLGARNAANGSSPRVWGTPRRQRPDQCGHRFIPTGVGNTL